MAVTHKIVQGLISTLRLSVLVLGAKFDKNEACRYSLISIPCKTYQERKSWAGILGQQPLRRFCSVSVVASCDYVHSRGSTHVKS